MMNYFKHKMTKNKLKINQKKILNKICDPIIFCHFKIIIIIKKIKFLKHL